MTNLRTIIEQYVKDVTTLDNKYTVFQNLKKELDCVNKLYKDWPIELQKKWNDYSKFSKYVTETEEIIYSDLKDKVFKIDDSTILITYYCDDNIVEIRKVYIDAN